MPLKDAVQPSRGASQPSLPPFHHSEAYPDAQSVFHLNLEPIESIKDQAIVVLDTNVLLLPYTVNSKSLGSIRSTYEQLKQQSRLFIPAQVAREFAANRATKLGEMYLALSRIRDSGGAPRIGDYPLLEGVDEYIRLGELEADLKSKLKEYHSTLGTLIERVRGWRWNDPVSVIYREVFGTDVVVEPAGDRSEIERFLAHRRTNRLAPGYKDAGKADGGVGDALIWRTILDLGTTHNQHVIFVSGDEKPDWWHRSEKSALYPRFDLANEFWRATAGRSFHQLRFSDMLALFEAPREVIAEVRLEEAVVQVASDAGGHLTHYDSRHSDLRPEASYLDAVRGWLVSRFRGSVFSQQPGGFPDLVGQLREGVRLGVEVKVFAPTTSKLSQIAQRSIYHSVEAVTSGTIDVALIVIVAEDPIEARHARNVVQRAMLRPDLRSMEQIGLVAGYLQNDGFVPITEMMPHVFDEF